MTVPGSHLGRRRLYGQTDGSAHMAFDLGWDVGIGAHRSRDLADGHRIAGRHQPGVITGELECPPRQLQAEGGGLRPDPVGASDHVGGAVFLCSSLDDFEQTSQRFEKQIGRLFEGRAEGGVEDVGGGEPIVDPCRSPPRLRPRPAGRRRPPGRDW